MDQPSYADKSAQDVNWYSNLNASTAQKKTQQQHENDIFI